MQPKLGDMASEHALIGAAFLDESVLDVVALRPEHFFGQKERRLWDAMLALHAEGKAIDPIVVAERAELPESDVSACLMTTATAGNAEHYAHIVREYAISRAVMGAVSDISTMFRQDKATGSELLGEALKAMTAIDVERSGSALTIGEVVIARFRELAALSERQARGESVLTGVPTGIDKLDELLSGIQPGIVTIIAGRPAMGKSALAQGITDAASERGYGVHVFSLEDAQSAYADRAMARRAGVPTTRIRTCQLQKRDMPGLVRSAADLQKREGWLYDDVSDISAEGLVRAVRRERSRNDTRLVVVDYLQLLQRPKRHESVHDAITQNLDVLARAAKHDNIAYLVLSQLSRSVEKRQDKRPMLADLRESGSIEERSKCVLAMYRGSYYGEPKAGIDYDDDDPNDRRPSDIEWERRVDVLVLKNSHGDTGLVRCKWDGPCTRVY